MKDISNNKLILRISIIALLIIGLIAGGTYAYFVATVTQSEASSIEIGSASISVSLTSDNEISASNILPGWFNYKDFLIEVKGLPDDVKINYDVYFEISTNSFSTNEYGRLTYQLYSCNENWAGCSTPIKTETTVPLSGTEKINSGDVENGKIYYRLIVSFPNDPDKEQTGQGASFTGKFYLGNVSNISMED